MLLQQELQEGEYISHWPETTALPPFPLPPPPFPLSLFIIHISLMKTVPNSKGSGCWSVWKRRTAQSTLPRPETGLQTLCSAVLAYVKTIHCHLNSDSLLLLPVLSTILVLVLVSNGVSSLLIPTSVFFFFFFSLFHCLVLQGFFLPSKPSFFIVAF